MFSPLVFPDEALAGIMHGTFGLGGVLADALAGKQERVPAPFEDSGQPMSKSKVLYRSVSPPELVDIWRHRVIVGGGSLFNPFDRRTDVFFADEIDDLLIGHGEHIPRQVTFALRNHSTSRRSEFLDRRISRRADLILAQMDRDRIPYDRDCAEDFRIGLDVSKFRRATFKRKHRNGWNYALHFRALRRLLRKQEAYFQAYNQAWAQHYHQRQEALQELPYSSVIIVTHPIGGGVVYSAESGWCGHGEREYGFRPGQVTLQDISEIILLKERREVGRCSPFEIGQRLEELAPLPAGARLDAR